MSDKIRKYVLPNLPYLFVFWFFSKIGTAYRIAPGTDFGTKLMGMLDTFPKAFETYWPGLGGIDLLVGLAGAAGVYLLIQSKIRQAKKFRRDAEYGTARFGTKEDTLLREMQEDCANESKDHTKSQAVTSNNQIAIDIGVGSDDTESSVLKKYFPIYSYVQQITDDDISAAPNGQKTKAVRAAGKSAKKNLSNSFSRPCRRNSKIFRYSTAGRKKSIRN